MEIALQQARAAAAAGEVPVGAVLTDAAGASAGGGAQQVETAQNPLAHAEMLVLEAARAARGQKYLADCTLTVTLEPCALCAGAIAALARGAGWCSAPMTPRPARVEHGPRLFSHATTHHKPEVIGGLREAECAALLTAFFAGRRDA